MAIVLGRKPGGSGGGGAPSGPAGGGLTGTYPNPTIANDAVDTAQIADDAVEQAQIADAAVGRSQIATGVAVWDLIEEISRGTDGAIDFQSIPGTYRHLKILCSIRGAQAFTTGGLRVRFNNDTGANYDSSTWNVLNVTGGGAVGEDQTFFVPVQVVGDSAPANEHSSIEIFVPYYANTSRLKSMQGQAWGNGTGAAAGMTNSYGGGRWNSTAAITRVTLTHGTGAGEWNAGSIASLYGIG